MDIYEMIKLLYLVEELQGYDESDIVSAKNHFGALPQVVENFWRKAGRTEAIHHIQDHWSKPEEWQKNCDYLILLTENQGCFITGIQKTDLKKADPPVYIKMNDKDWALCTETTSEFLQAVLAYESIFTFSYVPEDFVFWLTDEEKEIISENLEKKSFMLHGWMNMDISFYSNASDNMAAIMECDEPQVIYGAASEESYEKLLDVMEDIGES
jgi:hypothetical protein